MIAKRAIPDTYNYNLKNRDYKSNFYQQTRSKILEPVNENSVEQSVLTTKLQETSPSMANFNMDNNFIKIEESMNSNSKRQNESSRSHERKKCNVLNESLMKGNKNLNNISNIVEKRDNHIYLSLKTNLSNNKSLLDESRRTKHSYSQSRHEENKPQKTESHEEYEALLIQLREEKEKNRKLSQTISEKEKLISSLQYINTKMENELDQKEAIIFENKRKMEVKDRLIFDLQKSLEKNDYQQQPTYMNPKTNTTPLQDKNKSSHSDLTSTKNSLKNPKSCQSTTTEKESLHNENNSNIKNYFQFNNNDNKTDLFKLVDETLKNLVNLLNINSLEDVIPKINKIIAENKSYNKFHDSLNKAIIECSPEGRFKNSMPSLKESWKWIKDLIVQYMNLKRNENKLTITMSQLISPKTSHKFNELTDHNFFN
jgi:hypothetical protein